MFTPLGCLSDGSLSCSRYNCFCRQLDSSPFPASFEDCGFDTDWASLRTYDEPFELSDRCVTRPVSRADNNSPMFLREVRRCGSGLLLAASFFRDINTCQCGKCFFCWFVVRSVRASIGARCYCRSAVYQSDKGAELSSLCFPLQCSFFLFVSCVPFLHFVIFVHLFFFSSSPLLFVVVFFFKKWPALRPRTR